ncbi:uncharacterized protein UTRI_02657_B [Ustilago trichophora]|uniref:UDENN domain-containing protein n=1 Tax=Ustilago trichophora TaxID=86804 RepID=A0A5C3E7L1_9BASI|nr:uncharacterized protein UTRI_02657_B [Ustilago trichophora]
MRPSQPEAGPSSAPNLNLRPANVLTIFLARFHVRHGNQIEYQYPPPPKAKGELIDVDQDSESSEGLDLAGVEWKVLPSGGHLIEKDVIYFQTSSLSSSSKNNTTGVACFRNLKLESTDSDAAGQRGARMLSVGLVLQCEGDADQPASALAQQLAIVPHLGNLERLADEVAHDPEDTYPLKAYYDAHKARINSNSSELDGKRMKQLRMRRRRDPRNLPHDPISHMPALCGSLGALLPHLLKKLMLPHHRLLIFSPSPPLVHAAWLGFNLADLIALAIARSGKRHENLQSFARRGIVTVKGQIGVHDIPTLEDEEKQRNSDTPSHRAKSWIAWSTDKILLEKPHLFDSVLDLTPLIGRESSGGILDEAALESASSMARLMTVVRPAEAKPHLKVERHTTREFATFNELDAQAQRHAERAERFGGACVSRRKSRSKFGKSGSRNHDTPLQEQTQTQEAVEQWRGGCSRSPRRSAGTLSAVLAFLRYWLAGWWFLPSHWRYGLPAAYVLPLGIRGDGGVRASILLMPEDESDEEEEDVDEEDREIAAEDEEEEERRSALAAEPDVLLATLKPGDDAHLPHMHPDQQTSTNSSSDTEGLPYPQTTHHHHHLIPPDPLLAAVGASPVFRNGESDRHSHSASLHRRRSTDRSLYARSSVSVSDMDETLFDEGELRFRSILSDSLWMVWSHWTTALVSGLLDILEDRLAQIEADDEEEVTEEGDVSQLLVAKVTEGLEVKLGQADMASLGLSAGSRLDVDLVETLGSQFLGLLTSSICMSGGEESRVVVRRGWGMFRWLL